jgi:hypothetical protein
MKIWIVVFFRKPTFLSLLKFIFIYLFMFLYWEWPNCIAPLVQSFDANMVIILIMIILSFGVSFFQGWFHDWINITEIHKPNKLQKENG